MKKCKKGVMWKDSVSRYYNNGLVSILKLANSLKITPIKLTIMSLLFTNQREEKL